MRWSEKDLESAISIDVAFSYRLGGENADLFLGLPDNFRERLGLIYSWNLLDVLETRGLYQGAFESDG